MNTKAQEYVCRRIIWTHKFIKFFLKTDDREYIEYVVSLVQKAHEYGIVVFVDPHQVQTLSLIIVSARPKPPISQDAWSRWTGGSGAPYWTLEAAGFNLDNLDETQAAITHQNWGDPLPRMVNNLQETVDLIQILNHRSGGRTTGVLLRQQCSHYSSRVTPLRQRQLLSEYRVRKGGYRFSFSCKIITFELSLRSVSKFPYLSFNFTIAPYLMYSDCSRPST